MHSLVPAGDIFAAKQCYKVGSGSFHFPVRFFYFKKGRKWILNLHVDGKQGGLFLIWWNGQVN